MLSPSQHDSSLHIGGPRSISIKFSIVADKAKNGPVLISESHNGAIVRLYEITQLKLEQPSTVLRLVVYSQFEKSDKEAALRSEVARYALLKDLSSSIYESKFLTGRVTQREEGGSAASSGDEQAEDDENLEEEEEKKESPAPVVAP